MKFSLLILCRCDEAEKLVRSRRANVQLGKASNRISSPANLNGISGLYRIDKSGHSAAPFGTCGGGKKSFGVTAPPVALKIFCICSILGVRPPRAQCDTALTLVPARAANSALLRPARERYCDSFISRRIARFGHVVKPD